LGGPDVSKVSTLFFYSKNRNVRIAVRWHLFAKDPDAFVEAAAGSDVGEHSVIDWRKEDCEIHKRYSGLNIHLTVSKFRITSTKGPGRFHPGSLTVYSATCRRQFRFKGIPSYTAALFRIFV
jgi:hypothetical protein